MIATNDAVESSIHDVISKAVRGFVFRLEAEDTVALSSSRGMPALFHHWHITDKEEEQNRTEQNKAEGFCEQPTQRGDGSGCWLMRGLPSLTTNHSETV